MDLISPFQNDDEATSLDGLTIENSRKRVAIYGNIALTRDKKGLATARELRNLLDEIVRMLESDKQLPDEIAHRPTTMVDNPFA
jgi:hypothetical protein